MAKTTTEEFKNEVFLKYGNEFTVLGEYVGNKEKILLKHNSCGSEYLVIPVVFLKKKYCKKCSFESQLAKQRKAPEVYEQEINEKYNGEYKVLSPYVNQKTKIKFLHNSCGGEFESIPTKVACPVCGRKSGTMKARKSPESFLEEIKSLVADEYSVLTPYVNAIEKVGFKHNTCGHSFLMKPNNFLNGQRCPKCKSPKKILSAVDTNKVTITREDEFLSKMKKAYGDEYIVLTEYKDKNTEVKIKHRSCGEEFNLKPSNALKKGVKILCKKCRNEKIKEFKVLSQEEVKEKVFKILGSDYEVQGDYEAYEKAFPILHKTCGRVFKKSLSSIEKNGQCTYCKKEEKLEKEKKSQEEFEREVQNAEEGNYQVLGQYVNRVTKIKLLHKQCGHIYEASPGQFIQGERCPVCCESKGETFIRKWLQKNNITFERQYKFPDCRDKQELFFDFKVNKNEKIVLLEYDGIQHFQSVKFFGGQEGFEKIKKRDKIKDDYCKNNNYDLFRFPYNLNFIEVEKKLQEIFLQDN